LRSENESLTLFSNEVSCPHRKKREMTTSSQFSKPAISSGKKKTRSRNPNGHPQPYRDGSRWKAKGTFLDATGQRHHVYGTGSTQVLAMKRRDELLLQKRQSLALRLLPLEVVCVAEFCVYWLDEVKQGRGSMANKTYLGYQAAIDKWIRPYLGKLRLSQLTRQHLIALMSEVTKQGFSKSIQNQIRAVLKPALDEAEIEGYIQRSPWRSIPMQKAKSGQPTSLTLKEVRRILDAARTQGSQLRWQLSLMYGARQGECLGIRWSDISLEDANSTISISRQLQRVTGKGLISVPLKTVNSYRTIALTPNMVELFRAAREAHMTAQTVYGPTWNSEGYVFVTPLGTPLDPSNDRKSWIKLLADAGVDFKRLHVARHTAATHAANLNVASKMLGHSSIRVTADFYAAAPTAAMRESLEGFEKLLDEEERQKTN
jgi:integrase